MGKYFKKEAMSKLAMMHKLAADPTIKEHHSNFGDSKAYVNRLTKFYSDAGSKSPDKDAAAWSAKNPWSAPPAIGQFKSSKDYEQGIFNYYKKGSSGGKENTTKTDKWVAANPWSAGIANPGAKYGFKNYKSESEYMKAVQDYYGDAGSKDPTGDMKKWVKSNPWSKSEPDAVAAPTTEALRPNRSANRVQYEKKVKDYYKATGKTNTDAQNEELAQKYLLKNKYTEEGREEEGRNQDYNNENSDEMDRALDSPYAGASPSDVYRSVRRARMKRMFGKLRKNMGQAKAKQILDKSEAIARERRELVKSDTDRMDQGDPNSVDSMVYEIPEGQARYEVGARDFKSQLETLKISHVPSGGAGLPVNEDEDGQVL